jgi:hypothetical protein
MALLDNGLLGNGLKSNVVTGLAIGIGAAILAPVIIPMVAAIVKPLAKATIKGGLILYERGKEVVAETGEMVEDLVAEARSELSEAAKNGGNMASATSEPEGKVGA